VIVFLSLLTHYLNENFDGNRIKLSNVDDKQTAQPAKKVIVKLLPGLYGIL
jgi:N-acyl-D-aspartate/D-glutamate deacylase